MKTKRTKRRGGDYACPHCGEDVDTWPDAGGGEHQEYIEDCPLCCRPNRIVATWSDELGAFEVHAFADT